MSLKGKEPASNAPREKEQLRKVVVYADNFQMATNAVAKFNHEKPLKDTVQLENDGFYAFFENWQSRKSAQESASGLAHVRLIIGQYKCGPGELRKSFVGHGYDLTKPPEDITTDLQKGLRGTMETLCRVFLGGSLLLGIQKLYSRRQKRVAQSFPTQYLRIWGESEI